MNTNDQESGKIEPRWGPGAARPAGLWTCGRCAWWRTGSGGGQRAAARLRCPPPPPSTTCPQPATTNEVEENWGPTTTTSRVTFLREATRAHSAVVTAANVHDKHPLPDPLHGNEQRVYGDSAYASHKDLIAGKAPNAKDFTNQRTRYAGIVDEAVRTKNRNKSRIRSRVEHVFGVVKRLWGFGKTRYRGRAKNATRAFTALALANIYLSRKRLMAQVRP